MLKELDLLCTSLEELARKVVTSWGDDRTLREAFGWNCPALTRHDLGRMASSLAARIREAQIESLEKEVVSLVSNYPKGLNLIRDETVQYLYNGHAVNAAPAYIQTIKSIEDLLLPYLDWKQISDNRLIPAKLHRRLRSMEASLDEIVPERDELIAKIKLINDATEAADSLPADLESLKRARDVVDGVATTSAATLGKIQENHKNSSTHLEEIQKEANEAQKLIKQCQEAYRVTTTTGLAASFDARARSLSYSLWAWVIGLLIALGVGSYIGSLRVAELTTALKGNTHWGVVAIHIVLSVFSVGAPVWFAWLATKQIGQRFRLAEDYGFKASVAKAYEGYRREAARIDKSFEARLFGSALTRLEEAPLRLVEEETHGSPWHELVSSPAFQSALEKFPSLREKFLGITISNGSERLPGTAPAATAD